MLRPCFVRPRRRRAAKHLGYICYIWKRFCKSRCVIISTLSSRIASMEFIDRKTAPFIHSGEKWKTRTKSRSEMPVRTVSQRFSHLPWKNTRVWETQKKKLGLDYHRLKAMVKRSIEQQIRNKNFWEHWEERHGQESENETACTKCSSRLLAVGK